MSEQEVIGIHQGQGLTLAQVADRVGISRRQVVRVLERHHVPRRQPGRRPRIAGQAEQQIIGRYASWLSQREAGQPFGAGADAVTAVLDRHKAARRPCGAPGPRRRRPGRRGFGACGLESWLLALAGEVTTVGRGAGCSVRLDDLSVGVLHAELVRRGPYVYVCSLAGPDGATRVNGQVMAGGDVISFGLVACAIFPAGVRGDLAPGVLDAGSSLVGSVPGVSG